MLDFWHSYSVTTICFLVVAFCLWRTWYQRKDFFNPLNVYVFTQCFTLGIAYLKLDPAMTDFKVSTWMVWLGALFAFILGTTTYYLLDTKEKLQQVDTSLGKTYNWELHFLISNILLCMYLIGVGLMIRKVGTLIILTNDISKWVSTEVSYGIYTSVAVASSPLVVMFFMVSAFKSVNPEHPKMRIYSIIISFVIIVLTVCVYPSRASLFLALGFVLILFNILKKRIPIRLIVGSILVAVALFVMVALFRAQYGTNTLEGMAARKAMHVPYVYAANNYWNLDYMLNSPSDMERHPFTYGVDALNGMFEYTRLPGAIRNSMGWDGMFNESVHKVSGYNTTGYLWEVYKDWGIAGVIIFPFMVSFFMSFLYEKMKRARSPTLWMLFTMFLFYIGWWFFLAGYKFGMFWLWVYIILVATRMCMRRRKFDAIGNG